MIENLVAGIEDGAEQDIERFGDADGHQDLVFWIIFRTIILGDITRDFVA